MKKTKTSINRLIAIMARLRAKKGCPWDRKQTLATLKQYLIEECYEVVDAIDSGNADRHAEELGDLLLQVVFQAQIRAEKKQFDFNDVVRTVCAKLIRRHPHVFGSLSAASQREVLRNWEKIKAREKTARNGEQASIIEGIPRHLPALHKAHQFQQRLARIGFDWKDARGVMAKIEEELEEVREALARGNERQIRTEVGDLLFAVVNLCRFRKMRAEEVLQDAVVKFSRRFREVERLAHADRIEITRCPLKKLDKYWETAKKSEKKALRAAARPGEGKTATPRTAKNVKRLPQKRAKSR